MENIYDVAIVGAGPAGLSASIYASRYKLKNIVFGKQIGGTIADAHKVCNYPGVEDIPGLELGSRMYEQAKKNGAETSLESVVSIEKEGDLFKLATDSKKEITAKTIILATGTKRNKLRVPGEEKYLGSGVSYCCTCDAMFYKDKVVGVVGGSSAAIMAATMLADIAKQVYIIYRGTALRGEPAWIDDVKSKKNIEIILTTVVTAIEGDGKVERVKLSKEFNGSDYLDLDGLFIEIGSEPNADLPIKLGVELNENQYIVVKDDQSTSIEGIWAAGDATTNSNKLQQVVTAVGEGAVAANSIYDYLKKSSILNH
ncbi:MAG: thioredoxin reductase [candidate division WS6 bacterium 34_10]|jgi:thioredoxin reductase (NADPH)|uniref:Thioredoxin reductase n=1 Tax=candidate division WS6 bacterium 34_10 TaxID=1641389 RepID=A0A101HIT8_9BACT|nr:MAG: thioredoxin reductase [candidate division WS6 bacterium 34_10]